MKYFSIFIFTLLGYTSFCQEEFHVIDIENDSLFEDLAILDTTDSSSRLFFSGENHRFQKSNLKLELKLLKYFHQKHGVNTLLLEFGDVTGWMVNEYIKTGDKKLEKAVGKHFSKNFLNYFKEIKKYNDSLTSTKILVEGIDLQRSFPIGFEMLNHLLPEDSIRPNDSILQQIELIKFLQGYNKNKNSWGNDNALYYYGRQGNVYSNQKSMKLVINNYNKFKGEYKRYFGENFNELERFMVSIKESSTYFDKKKTGTPIGILYREEYMYTKINNLARDRPKDKFYGQFGRNHTLRNVNSNGYTYNFSSLVAKIDKNKESVLHKKVFSAGIYYLTQGDYYNSYNASNYSVKSYIVENLTSLPKDSIAILKVIKGSELDSILEYNYDFIIVHNGRYKNEGYANNEWNYNETISFNFIYGQYLANLGSTYDYLGINGTVRPIQYWGLTYSFLSDGAYFDYQFLSFLNSKHTLSDTSSAEFRGFNISMNVGYDLLKSRRVDFIPMIGFGYQQSNLKIFTDNVSELFSGINTTEYRLNNPSVYFDFAGEFRLMIIKDFLGLSLKSGYRLDVSDSQWKYRNTKLEDARFNQSGLFFQAGLCFGSF